MDNWGNTLDVRQSRLVLLPSSTTATSSSAARRTCCCVRRSRRRSTATRSTRPCSTASASSRPASRPPGIPGFKEDICEYCAYDPEAAQAAFDEWTAAGNALDGPLPIQFNAGGGHERRRRRSSSRTWPRSASRPSADPQPTRDVLLRAARRRHCVFCRSGWYADYPTYDNFMYDLFAPTSLDGNNYGFSNPEFDDLVAKAKPTTDPDAARRPVQPGRGDPAQHDVDGRADQLVRGRLRVRPGEGRATSPDAARARSRWEQVVVTRADRLQHLRDGGRRWGASASHRHLTARTGVTAMFSYIVRRLLQLIPTVFFAISFLFFLFFVLPGDPATLIAGGAEPQARTRDVVEQVTRALRPRRPVLVQFVELLGARPPLGPRRVVRNNRQRQRHPRREGAAQHPPGLLGDAHRGRRRHPRRADLRRQALLVHRQAHHDRHRRGGGDPGVRARASSSSTRSPSTRTSTTGPSGCS